jgi:hypothetical protein
MTIWSPCSRKDSCLYEYHACDVRSTRIRDAHLEVSLLGYFKGLKTLLVKFKKKANCGVCGRELHVGI